MEKHNYQSLSSDWQNLKCPAHFPFQDTIDLEHFHGFQDIIGELNSNSGLYHFNHLDYLNQLYWFISNIERNKETYYLVALDIQKEYENLKDDYGHILYYHLLYLIKKHLEYAESEEIKREFETIFEIFFILGYWEVIDIVRSEFIKAPTLSLFFSNEPKINSWITCNERSDINIAIFYYLKERGKSKEEILIFYSLIYHFIGIISYRLDNPPDLLDEILNPNPIFEENQEFVTFLLYWILIMIRDKIGFEKALLHDPGKEVRLLIAYKFFNGQAKILNCSPDQDISPIYFKMLSPEQFETNRDESPDTIPVIFESQHIDDTFKVKLSDNFSKIDVIRLLDVIYSEELIQTPPKTKTKFMIKGGEAFGLDLSDYANDLRAAKRAYPENQLAIFDILKKAAENLLKKEEEKKQQKEMEKKQQKEMEKNHRKK